MLQSKARSVSHRSIGGHRTNEEDTLHVVAPVVRVSLVRVLVVIVVVTRVVVPRVVMSTVVIVLREGVSLKLDKHEWGGDEPTRPAWVLVARADRRASCRERGS